MMILGLDLAWATEPAPRSSGACLLDGEGRLLQLDLLTGDEEVRALIPEEGWAWVGIDAPLLVPNLKGMRRCERRLLAMGLRCLPSNQEFMLSHFGGMRGEALARSLEGMGFAAASPSRCGERTYFEVYPYGTLRLIMGRVPRYKRGKLEERRRAIHDVIGAMEAWDAPLGLCERLRRETDAARRSELKGLTDLVDAALSAACVYSHHISRGRRTQLVGDEGQGYVLLPAQRSQDEGRERYAGRLPGGGRALRVQRGRG
ncbi:MAG: DUF429 domain-containing protein [Methanomassiliicoccales archaeon]|nr:DUF429 domain-containing protein [Methanomassiliicoccales archaeon]